MECVGVSERNKSQGKLAKPIALYYNVLRGELIYMPHVSLRVSEQEKNWMESYAKLNGINLSDAIKMAFFEKLDDEYDLNSIREYETEKKNGTVKYFSLDEVKRELRLDE